MSGPSQPPYESVTVSALAHVFDLPAGVLRADSPLAPWALGPTVLAAWADVVEAGGNARVDNEALRFAAPHVVSDLFDLLRGADRETARGSSTGEFDS